MGRIHANVIAGSVALAGLALALPGPAVAQSMAQVDWPATWTDTEIRVWFEGVGSDYERMVWDAFRAWESDEVPLDVRPAASISEANLLVMEAAHPLDPSGWLGQTTIRGWGHTIQNAVVRFSRLDHRGLPIPKGLRKRTALHEIGHVLGLGHGPEGRIMHGVTAADQVTELDRAELGALYRGVRGVADARTLEAEDTQLRTLPLRPVARIPFRH